MRSWLRRPVPSYHKSYIHPPPPHSSYLLLLLLLLLLCEEGVNPPDLGEHAAVRQAEAEAEQPEAELGERAGREEWEERWSWSCLPLQELLWRLWCVSYTHYCSVFAVIPAVLITLLGSPASLFGLFTVLLFQGSVTLFHLNKIMLITNYRAKFMANH